MNTKLKASIEDAIDTALNSHAEDHLWDNYIHPNLVKQMTEAAESVFDAAQDAQSYLKTEEE